MCSFRLSRSTFHRSEITLFGRIKVRKYPKCFRVYLFCWVFVGVEKWLGERQRECVYGKARMESVCVWLWKRGHAAGRTRQDRARKCRVVASHSPPLSLSDSDETQKRLSTFECVLYLVKNGTYSNSTVEGKTWVVI